MRSAFFCGMGLLLSASSISAHAETYVFEVTAASKKVNGIAVAYTPTTFQQSFIINVAPTTFTSATQTQNALVDYDITAFLSQIGDELAAFSGLLGIESGANAQYWTRTSLATNTTVTQYLYLGYGADAVNYTAGLSYYFGLPNTTPLPTAPATSAEIFDLFLKDTTLKFSANAYKSAGIRSNRIDYTGTATLISINGVLVSGVPEPSAWAMMALGLFAVGCYARRVRRRHGDVRVSIAERHTPVAS